MTVTEGMMEGAQGHDVSIPIFADSALATRPQTSSIMSHARAANEALYSHKCVKIVSFAASEINRTSTTDKHARGAREAWQSPFERTIAFGSFSIYRPIGSVAFMSCGTAIQPILPKSQCWQVDEHGSKFVLQIRHSYYWRIELPVSTMEQEQQAHHFKRLLQEILLFEKTSCPFLRPFKAVLPNTIMSERNGRQIPGQVVNNLAFEEDNCASIEQMPEKRLVVRSGHPRDASWKNSRNIQAPMGWAMPSAATYEHAQCDFGTDHRIKKRPQIVFSRTIMRQQKARLEPLPFYHFNCVNDTLSQPNMWSVGTNKGNEQSILLSDECTEMSHSVSDLSSCLRGSGRRSSRRDHLRRHSSRSTSRPPETSQMLNLQESDGRAVSEDITENSSLLKAISQGLSHCGIIVMTSSAQASDLCGRPKKIGSPKADFLTQSGLTSSIKQVVHHQKGEYRRYDRTTLKGQIIKLGYLPLAIMNKTYDISMKSPGMLVEMMRKAAGMVGSQGDCQGLRHPLPGRMIPVRWDHSTLGVRDWGIEDPGRQFMT